MIDSKAVIINSGWNTCWKIKLNGTVLKTDLIVLEIFKNQLPRAVLCILWGIFHIVVLSLVHVVRPLLALCLIAQIMGCFPDLSRFYSEIKIRGEKLLLKYVQIFKCICK